MLPRPIPPCSSGMTKPNMPNSLSSSMKSSGSSPATSHFRKSSARVPSRPSSAPEMSPSVSFCASDTVGKGQMTSCSMRPMHRDRMKLVVSLSATGRSFFEGAHHARVAAARPWPLGASRVRERFAPARGRRTPTINEKGTARFRRTVPLERSMIRAVGYSRLPAAPLEAVAEESDLFLFLPRTPQNAVPAPRRQAKPRLRVTSAEANARAEVEEEPGRDVLVGHDLDAQTNENGDLAEVRMLADEVATDRQEAARDDRHALVHVDGER